MSAESKLHFFNKKVDDIHGVLADLAPEGLVGADEGPLGRLLHQALSVLVGVADVEHLSTGCFKKRVIFKGTVQ